MINKHLMKKKNDDEKEISKKCPYSFPATILLLLQYPSFSLTACFNGFFV